MTRTTPLVSVYCLTYNHSKYIKDTLDGFVMQKTNFPFEVFVYDDCSTDGNQRIIQDYCEKYPGLFHLYLSKINNYSNGSLRFATSTFLSIAKGKYMAFCEGDDYWVDPFKLQNQVNLFRANPGMTYCFTNRIVREEIKGRDRIERYSSRKYTQEDFLSGFNPGIQSVMADMACIKGYDFMSEFKGVNGDRLLPYLCLKHGFAKCLESETSVYRINPMGVSTSVALNSKPSDYFRHACDDFYRYHEKMGFPYKKGYMKASAKYAINYLTKRKGFDFRLFYDMTSRYNGKNNILQLVGTFGILVYTIISKLLKKSITKLSPIWNKFTNLFKKERFCSCIVELSSLEDISKNKIVKKLEVPKFSFGNKPTTIADIFLFSKKGKLYAFYEYQNRRNAKGLIYMTCTEDGYKWADPRNVLEEKVHLSFPFIFEDKEDVYMIPETSFLNEIRLYKANEDLTDFTFVKTLVANERFVDTCVYIKNGVYYMFTSVQYDDNSYELKLYYSESLDGEWTIHPSSPLSVGKADARNAGCIINYNGMLLRPAQECRKFYGQNTHLFRIKELSKDNYEEEPFVLDLIPKGWQDSIGGHQLSIASFGGKMYAGVDLLKFTYRLYEVVQKIKGRILK